MDILVVGLGSMGKRRIRLIKELYSDFGICGVDSREERRKESHKLFQINCYESIGQAKKKENVEVAFVCTSPLSHSAIIEECLMYKWNVFTELNLVSDGYEKNMKLAKANDCKLFLSSTFLFREEIRYINNKVTEDKKWNYVYHIGQYLPDWHPWENYKDFFVGDKRTNGCREILAIELPWIIHAFGSVERTMTVSDKMTELKIDYNDNYMIQINHRNGNKGMLIVDIVSPVAVRRLEVYSENEYLQWDGTPNSLMEYDRNQSALKGVELSEEEHNEKYSAFVIENAYKNEIKEFFDVILNGKQPVYGFERDLEILTLIDTMEKTV